MGVPQGRYICVHSLEDSNGLSEHSGTYMQGYANDGVCGRNLGFAYRFLERKANWQLATGN